MPGVKISSLPSTTLNRNDIFPVARGGITFGVRASDILDRFTKNDTDFSALTANTIYVIDSPTIDLTYNSTTRRLSADLQQNLDLRTRVMKLPCDVEVPPGTVTAFLGTTAPCGWLMCNGDVIPNTVPGTTDVVQGKAADYSRLYSVLQATGNAFKYDGTVRLPDLRGQFIRGFGANAWDGNTTTSTGTFGSFATDTFQGHKHYLHDPKHGHTGTANSAGKHKHEYEVWTDAGSDLEFGETHDDGMWEKRWTEEAGEHTHTVTVADSFTDVKVLNPIGDQATPGVIGDVNGPGGTIPRVSNETRPRNVSLLWVVKY